MASRSARFVPLALVVVCACSGTEPVFSADPPAGCPVTKPPAPPFIPPGVEARFLDPDPDPDLFAFGTPKLWTFVLKPPVGMGEKITLFSEGYDWHADPQPILSMTLRRLDAPAPVLVNEGKVNEVHHFDPHTHIVGLFPGYGSYIPGLPSFIMSGVNFPSPGCWEITARINGEQLSFVYWVH